MAGFINKVCNWCSDKFFGIEPNISELKSNFDKNKVIVQYTPPKGLSPSEVGMIYYRVYKTSNINCLIYKWASEGIISFKDKGNSGRIRILKELNDSVPKYESSYWSGLLKFKRVQIDDNVYEIKDPENLMFGLHRIQKELLDYCIEKGWLKRTGNNNIKNLHLPLIPIIILILLVSLPILNSIISSIINYSLDIDSVHNFLEGYYLFGWLFVVRFIIVKGGELKTPTDIELTEEGEKLFVEIYGYKYFLEHCDEEKLKKLIKEDSNYIDKTLPYAIALRLNAKFLKYSLSNFSIGSLDIVDSDDSKNLDDYNNSNFKIKKL